MSSFVTAAAGVVAFIGIIGMALGASVAAPGRRNRIFRTGSFAITAAGLVLMLASLVWKADANEMFGGFLMMLFGSCASLASPSKAPSSGSDECAR